MGHIIHGYVSLLEGSFQPCRLCSPSLAACRRGFEATPMRCGPMSSRSRGSRGSRGSRAPTLVGPEASTDWTSYSQTFREPETLLYWRRLDLRCTISNLRNKQIIVDQMSIDHSLFCTIWQTWSIFDSPNKNFCWWYFPSIHNSIWQQLQLMIV